MPVTVEFPDGTKITGEVDEVLALIKKMGDLITQLPPTVRAPGKRSKAPLSV